MNKFISIIIFIIYCLFTIVDCYSSLPCPAAKRGPRIVGGTDTIKGEMPFIVSLTKRGGHFCGASILNEKWLITAAHCVCNGLNKILKASHIKGITGLHQFSEFKTLTEEVEEGTSSIRNKNYRPFEISFKRIIKHPEYDCSKTNDDIVSGWGWTQENQENGIRADILQKATVKVWNNKKCEDSYKQNGKNMSIANSQMCAGYENGKIDSCWADSGGPLVIENNILIGIVSTGIGCARPGLPGIYTRVNEYSKWIQSVISQEN